MISTAGDSFLAFPSAYPAGLTVELSEGMYLYDKSGKSYLDLTAGFCVNNLGHRHPAVIKAIQEQAGKYLHVTVYGEYFLEVQMQLAEKLAALLPPSLQSVYPVNSGTEAVEGALKLAKRITNRREIVSFSNAYHGSTQGALSVMGSEYFKNAFRPLLPEIVIIDFNNAKQLSCITEKTACVIVEPVQGEAGVIVPEHDFLVALRKQCDTMGCLLIFDEVQTGLRRTGEMFAFQKYNVIPDILILGKALGGGMPIAAFISSFNNMSALTHSPHLGHITTFGGHPLSCAAAIAAIDVLNSFTAEEILRKANLFVSLLKHPKIKNIRHAGLLMAIDIDEGINMQELISLAHNRGLAIDGFLLHNHAIRITPPLIINDEQIAFASETLCKCLDG